MTTKLLALLIAVSGTLWIVGLSFFGPLHEPIWITVTLGYVLGSAAVLFAAKRTSQLPTLFFMIWILGVVIAGLGASTIGAGLPLIGVALMYGTLGFVLWVSIPLVIYTFFRKSSAAE